MFEKANAIKSKVEAMIQDEGIDVAENPNKKDEKKKKNNNKQGE